MKRVARDLDGLNALSHAVYGLAEQQKRARICGVALSYWHRDRYGDSHGGKHGGS